MTAWAELFSEVKRVYRIASELLIDAERILEPEGFVCSHSPASRVGVNWSHSINDPEGWLPSYVARFFQVRTGTNAGTPTIYVACVFSDSKSDRYMLPDGVPLITAGIIRPRTARCPFWVAHAWLWDRPSVPAALEWRTLNTAGVLAGEGIESLDAFALPLETITSREELAERVVRPLIERAGPIPRGVIDESE